LLSAAIAYCRVTGPFALGCVLCLGVNEAPDFVALDPLRFHAAHVLIMIGKGHLTSIAEQLVDRINRTPDDTLG
jgi:hypothetical protein